MFGLFTFGLSSFGLPKTFGLSQFGLFLTTKKMRTFAIWATMMFGLSPFGLLWATRTFGLSLFGFKRINNFQTLYQSISSFLGLLEPFYANLFIYSEVLKSFPAIF